MASGTRRGAWKLLVGFLAVGLSIGCTQPARIGQRAPDFLLEALDGGSVSRDSLLGKVVFLHFWATWCPPCLVELPKLFRFYQGLDKQRFAVLAVCVDDQGRQGVREFLRSWGEPLPVYLDPGGVVARRFGTVRFPETYVLDPNGVVREKVIGAGDWEPVKWARFLQQILRRSAAGPPGEGQRAGQTP